MGRQHQRGSSTADTGAQDVGGVDVAEDLDRGNAWAAEQLEGGRAPQAGDADAMARGGAGTAGTALPATHAEAVQRHADGRGVFQDLLAWGKQLQVDPAETEPSRLTLFKNTCEWIDSGRAEVFVLSPIDAPSPPGGDVAYFDIRKNHESAATYNAANPMGDAGVAQRTDLWASAEGTRLEILDPMHPAWDENAVIGTLIHEVQHIADGGPDGGFHDAPSNLDEDTAHFWESYQSEFRAWTMDPASQDGLASASDPPTRNGTVVSAISDAAGTVKTATTQFQNALQESVFLDTMMEGQLAKADWWDWNTSAWTATYAYAPYYYATNAAYKAMVDGFTAAEGGNLLNSVRIDALADAIVNDPFVVARNLARKDLDSADRAFLQDRTRSEAFWELAERELSAHQLQLLYDAIGQVGPDDGTVTYTVVQGDTLSLIAERVLGDMSRWEADIYNYKDNRARIGPDPNLIEIGLKLVLPAE